LTQTLTYFTFQRHSQLDVEMTSTHWYSAVVTVQLRSFQTTNTFVMNDPSVSQLSHSLSFGCFVKCLLLSGFETRTFFGQLWVVRFGSEFRARSSLSLLCLLCVICYFTGRYFGDVTTALSMTSVTSLVSILLTLSLECQRARMSKITNDGLTRSGTGCFNGIWQQLASKG